MSMPKFEIRITQYAEQDLEDIYDFIKSNQTPAHADKLLDALVNKVYSLSAFPMRGSIPKELSIFGIDEFRQIILGTYRIIYNVEESIIYVNIITDGRRDMQALLERRLLTAETSS